MPVSIQKPVPEKVKDELAMEEHESNKLKKVVTGEMRKVGTIKFTCYMCSKLKPKTDFYLSTDARIQSGISRICKECANDIALKKDIYREYHNPTKESIMEALEYIDKPFLDKIFQTSIADMNKTDSLKKMSNLWNAYIKNISMPQYMDKRWKDSDHFKIREEVKEPVVPVTVIEEKHRTQEVDRAYELNKKNIIHIIKYDPFENYPCEADKPLLYAKLETFLDDETKNDGMKMNASIQIVKSFNQIERLNDKLDILITNGNLTTDALAMTKISEMIDKLVRSSSVLAKENGIAVNFNNNKSKGANTLSGKIKKLGELGFRDAQINGFDIKTCEGMQQVALISEEARHRQIGYDENIAQEIKEIRLELIEQLTKERDEAKERMRLLLTENKDLKSFLLEKGLVNDRFEVIDND